MQAVVQGISRPIADACEMFVCLLPPTVDRLRFLLRGTKIYQVLVSSPRPTEAERKQADKSTSQQAPTYSYPLEGTWPEHMQAPGAHFWGAFSMGPSQRWASYTPSSCLTLGNPKNRSDPISFLNLPQEDAPLGGDFPRQGHSPWSGLLGVAGLIRGGGGHPKRTDST